MFDPAWEVLVRDLGALRAFATTGEAIRKVVLAQTDGLELDILRHDLMQIKNGAPSNADWRVAEHAALIGRLYAVYEHFVEELLSKWLVMRTRGVTYTNLAPEFRAAYEAHFAAMLARAGEGRYDHLSYEAMISDQAAAYAGAAEWRVYPECLIHHDKNLRFETLNEVVTRCGVGDFQGWVSKSSLLANYFGGRQALLDRTQNELKEIVQYRNAAAHAHTAIDETIGLEQFQQYVDFIEALCRTLFERVSWLAVEMLKESQKARPIGRVSELYTPKTRTVVVIEGVTLRIGDIIFVRSDSSCGARKVLNIQDDGNPLQEIVVANAKEVGIEFSGPVRLNDQLFLVGAQD